MTYAELTGKVEKRRYESFWKKRQTGQAWIDRNRTSMRAARLEAGLRQSDLAELMATSRTTITRIESGREFPQIATLERWAELTGKQLEIRLF